MNKLSAKESYFKYSAFSMAEKSLYYSLIRKFLRRLNIEYPDFYGWYRGLFREDKSLYGSREIIVCEKDYRIAGIAILKSTEEERKICTLRVARAFQRQGIGKKLMELSFEWLQEDKPLITMHKSKQHEFGALLNYYGFTMEDEQWNYYNIFSTELSYNGILEKRTSIVDKADIVRIGAWYKEFVDSGVSFRYDLEVFMEKCIQKWYMFEKKRRIEMLSYD